MTVPLFYLSPSSFNSSPSFQGMRDWNSLETAHRYHKAEGFIVGVCICHGCGLRMDCAIEPETDMTKLSCYNCGKSPVDFEKWNESNLSD